LTTKVRWLCDIGGTISLANPDGSPNNDKNGVKRGQVSLLSDADAARYAKWGYVTEDLTLQGDELPLPFRTAAAGGSPRAGASPYRQS